MKQTPPASAPMTVDGAQGPPKPATRLTANRVDPPIDRPSLTGLTGLTGLTDGRELPVGTEDERFGFLRLLQEQGWIGPTYLIDYWDGNQLRQINCSISRSREPEVSDLPDELQDLLDAPTARFNTGDHAGAEHLLAQRLARVHNHAAAKDNLDAIRSFQGRREEAEQLLREVVADHPDYLAGRCNLANLAILDGDLE